MNVLFICKHNRFRSKVAETIFKKINKKDECISKGIKPENTPVSKNVINIMDEKGYRIADITPKLLDAVDLKWADRIIIVADNVDEKKFAKKKTSVWKVEDCPEDDLDSIKKRINLIESHVSGLLKEI